MDFPTNNAALNYKTARAALQTSDSKPLVPNNNTSGEAEGGFAAVQQLTDTIAKGEQAAISQITSGADPHSVIEAISAAELAVETAVTVRNKVVEAYQELIRMPI